MILHKRRFQSINQVKVQAILQCSICPPPFFTTNSRRRRHSVLLSMTCCDSFCHSVIIALFSSSTVYFRLRYNRLVAEGHHNHWIKIRAVWGPHVRLDEVNFLFLLCRVRWRAVLLKCSFVTTVFCSDVRQHLALFQDDFTVVA